MNEWHGNGPSRDQRGYGRGSGGAQPEGARAMPQVRRDAGPGYGRAEPPLPPGAGPRRGSVPPQQSQGYDDYNTGQVYGGGGPGGPQRGGYDTRPRPNWGRRIKWTVLTVVVVFAVASVATYFWADGKLRREVDLSKVIDRPEAGDGTNYLIVGSDSREGMTADDKKKLHTGSAEGKRTDSMMILHDGSNGPTLISLPRDSGVEIPSFVGSESGKKYPATGRRTKLNAAYAEDGAELLVRTVEYNTKLHIDHYVEIGFAGFANIVDAIGGVELDIPKAFKDKDSGSDFQAGKQTLNGSQALAFVRARHAFAQSDLARTKNQQKFLAALASQAASPGTLLNPFQLYPTLGAGLDTVIVDKDMGLWSLGNMFFAMKGVNSGEGTSMNMPMSGIKDGFVMWDTAKLHQLVQQLNNDEKVTVTDSN
ncbi:LCP family protein [Streptomyces benahoarensis]|uniref:LytR family transcriptional regulator n=1 Tax=Streptomyces benahoarensis TaxID=2595054 RepID=A0A553ZJF0_9ACTN|nr:LCP family protein [Streptomyces benahoarensis]TSB21815.1 LytR family transcriptional regulator [Streptomyces benahoarensis]TSB41591.1 LytR family transcriptional regulator [Streptomyces benahoarensis]